MLEKDYKDKSTGAGMGARPHLRPEKRSRSFQIQSNSDSKASDDLRQTALRNGLVRASSQTRVDSSESGGSGGMGPVKNKNIPMTNASFLAKRGDRFSQFTLDQSRSASSIQQSDPIRDPHKSSISPLTQVVQPSSKPRHIDVQEGDSPKRQNSSTDNKFENLQAEMSSHGSTHKSRKSSRGYEKSATLQDKRSDHNSMFSLAPISRTDSGADTSDEENADAENGRKDEDEDYTLDLQEVGFANVNSVLDFMQEVKGFRNTDTKQNLPKVEPYRSTRTHRKLLDMKMLRQEESDQSDQASLLFGGSLSYAVKRQHESIVSQWNQIRLRFSTYASPGRTANDMGRGGIIGSIIRNKNSFPETPRGSYQISPDQKDQYLRGLWLSESIEFQRKSVSSFGSSGEDLELNMDFSEKAHADMASMAKSAMLSRI